jgi:CheY-like chemotaxis protein
MNNNRYEGNHWSMINKSCILICDDPYDQTIFVRALSDVSPDTICFAVTDPSDALYLMAEEALVPSYIFAEFNMPGMDGIQFLKNIKSIEFLKDIPVIVHTISPQPNKVIELKESGALAIYLRPYRDQGVRNMLNLYFGDEMTILKPK